MELDDYVSARIREAGPGRVTRGKVLQEISDETAKENGPRVPVGTLRSIDKGYRLTHILKARAISAATGGAVTVEDLCVRAAR